MNILVLANEIPATSSMPGSPRLFNFCRHLSREHRLSMMTFNHFPERYRWFHKDPDTAGVFSELAILPDPPSPSWWNRQRHRLLLAAPTLITHLQPKYHQAIRQQLVEQITKSPRSDLIYVDGLTMTQYVDRQRDIPAVVDLHDSHTLFSQRGAKMERHLLRRIASHLDTRSIARWERGLADTFDLVITNSRVDESFMKQTAPRARTTTVPNGVDGNYFQQAGGACRPKSLVFTGVMAYEPNADAVIYFCRQVFPLIRQRFPAAEFWAVGQDPSLSVRSLSRDPGVHITGTVSDIRPYLHSAAVFVSPLRYGAGVKNKILAAMATRKPVIATSISLEGIDARPDHDVLVADTPQEFLDKVSRLFEDEDYASRVGLNGQRLVTGKYSWTTQAQLLNSNLKNLVQYWHP